MLAEDVIALIYHVKMRVQNTAHGEGSLSYIMLWPPARPYLHGDVVLPLLAHALYTALQNHAETIQLSSGVLASPCHRAGPYS